MHPCPRALPRARKSLLTRFATVLAGTTLAATAVTVAAPATAAHAVPAADTTSSQQSQMTARQRFEMKADEVLHVVANQKGDPYRWGATGPDAFDCSGLMYYSFRKALGRTLPRTANDQKRAADRIWHPRRNLRPGDLVFHVDGSYAYHVGIYAGHGEYWHSPHSGSHVKKDPISYGSGWAFGRIINS